MLTPDQITALAPDAASLKAGQGLATPRKWQSAGGDDEVLWGLAMGSGKEPYQTRVALGDLATKCSCPSRKFPCKHAIGLMLMSCSAPAALTEKERPGFVTEWLDSRAAREQKTAARGEEKAAKPIDEKAAQKRRAQRDNRVGEGIALLQQAILDVTREGLASPNARNAAAWENLARRMVDSQAPGLAGNLRHLTETVLRHARVDQELPLELGRLHLLLRTCAAPAESLDERTRAEVVAQLGGRTSSTPEDNGAAPETVTDDWLVAARTVEERDRLITSATWLLGTRSGRWARVLRFAPAPQTITEPWAVGATVTAELRFQPGLLPLRAFPEGDGISRFGPLPPPHEAGWEALLARYAGALGAQPFLRTLPFLIRLQPAESGHTLLDEHGLALPWQPGEALALRVACICGGHPALACGEWDGRTLRLLSIQDGAQWIPLPSQQA